MQECLGISISNKIVRYAKLEKDNSGIKTKSFGIRFWENVELSDVVNQIIEETNSQRTPISIDIEKEKYYFFNVVNLSKKYIDKAIGTEFESFCATNHISRNMYEGRYILTKNFEEKDKDKDKVIYMYDAIQDLEKREQLFSKARLTSAVPLPAALPNLIEATEGTNTIIVNLEENTTITSIINRKINHIDVVNLGLKEAMDKIAQRENSFQKTYERMKNTTIYTMEQQFQKMNEKNEYLEIIIPSLFKIATEVKNISSKYKKIDRVFLTGTGTVINNVDLFFQEYFKNSRVDILQPFFLTGQEAINIKDYVEVNSALAVALQGLKYGEKNINFAQTKPKMDIFKELLTSDISSVGTKIKQNRTKPKTGKKLNIDTDFSGAFDKLEIFCVRNSITAIVIIVLFIAASVMIKRQFEIKTNQANEVKARTEIQTRLADKDNSSIRSKTKDYEKYKENLEKTSSAIETKRSRKNQLTTLLNRIIYTIPKEVKLTSIENREIKKGDQIVQHIIIKAQAKKYEQLGFFKAQLKNARILDNITSSKGVKQGEIVEAVIEGDLVN